jgi:NADPH:quinone reductase-like Zn-dependent oxidoreductase
MLRPLPAPVPARIYAAHIARDERDSAGWTSYRALHDKLKITSADTLLITGGSGGTGSFAVRHPFYCY